MPAQRNRVYAGVQECQPFLRPFPQAHWLVSPVRHRSRIPRFGAIADFLTLYSGNLQRRLTADVRFLRNPPEHRKQIVNRLDHNGRLLPLEQQQTTLPPRVDAYVDLAAKAAGLLLAHPWKVWFWGDSIGVEGLLDASDLTGNPAYSQFAYGLLKGWLGREQHRGKFDYTAPGVALLRVYEMTSDPALLAAAYRHAEYMRSFRKTAAQAYMRYEDAAIELPPELPSRPSRF